MTHLSRSCIWPFVIALIFGGVLPASANHLKAGAYVEFVTKDGVRKFGSIKSLAKDCWLVLPDGKGLKLKAEEISGSELTGERLNVKPVTDYQKVRYPICLLTLTDGRQVKGGFSAHLSMWIDDTDGGVHRRPIGSYHYLKVIPRLPKKDEASELVAADSQLPDDTAVALPKDKSALRVYVIDDGRVPVLTASGEEELIDVVFAARNSSRASQGKTDTQGAAKEESWP